MTVSSDELLELERGFWTGDADFYKANADTECLVAFPGMSAAMANSDLADTVKDPKRWTSVEMDVKGMVQPGTDVAMLTYEARAERKGGEPYAALVSSGYVRRLDGWKLMFHSQVPLDKKS
ncbi:MAG: hypothetical protein ABTQ31_02355 [Rhizobiaceae bacterium]